MVFTRNYAANEICYGPLTRRIPAGVILSEHLKRIVAVTEGRSYSSQVIFAPFVCSAKHSLVDATPANSFRIEADSQCIISKRERAILEGGNG